ncbi:MAG: hypothetical protein KUG79_13530 [Pseudomonadales bacterium]|nr:hypothetical protein [Pseudomonadales bacterium]
MKGIIPEAMAGWLRNSSNERPVGFKSSVWGLPYVADSSIGVARINYPGKGKGGCKPPFLSLLVDQFDRLDNGVAFTSVFTTVALLPG